MTSGRSNQVNFNGGTLVASATLPLGDGAGTVTFNVKNGGANIDTNSNTVTISNPLVNFGGTSTGGLTKLNTGTLVLSNTNTYTGATTVSGGRLTIGSSGTIDNTSGVSIDAGEFRYNSPPRSPKRLPSIPLAELSVAPAPSLRPSASPPAIPWPSAMAASARCLSVEH